MNKPDAPQSASPEEEARIAETPAVFANKVYVSPMPGDTQRSPSPRRAGSRARTGRRRARRCFCNTLISPSLRRLLDWTVGADRRPKDSRRSIH